jgi:hypothetical protein
MGDCNTDHCLVVKKVRERLAVHKLDVDRFILRRIDERRSYETVPD